MISFVPNLFLSWSIYKGKEESMRSLHCIFLVFIMGMKCRSFRRGGIVYSSFRDLLFTLLYSHCPNCSYFSNFMCALTNLDNSHVQLCRIFFSLDQKVAASNQFTLSMNFPSSAKNPPYLLFDIPLQLLV